MACPVCDDTEYPRAPACARLAKEHEWSVFQ